MVFSNPEVVRQVQTNFVPVALKAALVNNPPPGNEGDLYREIKRTQAAPQGICVMNSAGKVLDWALSFDDEQSIPKFLDYVRQRYREHPAAAAPFPTRRYLRYPSTAMSDVADSGIVLEVHQQHLDQRCPAERELPVGTLAGTVIGRPLDENDQPIADTWRQEDYMEAKLEVSTSAQRSLADAVRAAGARWFRVPDSLVQELVGAAYLGQLDVAPLGQVPGSHNTARWWEFRAVKETTETDRLTQLRLSGRSHAAGEGRHWDHVVSLDWQGYIDLRGDRIQRLDLVARGNEKLRWGIGNRLRASGPDAAHLMAGHPIDLDTAVIYGIHAQPVGSQ